MTKPLPVFNRAIYSLLLVVAVAFVYGQFLWNPIVFDDRQYFMVGSEALDHYLKFSPLEVRWLPMASIAWTIHLFGRELIWLRLEGLILHAATGVALFLFLEQLYRVVLGRDTLFLKEIPYVWVAFFGALFFVLHPVAVYGAGYLIQRTIVMATLFSLLALYAYMRGLVEDRTHWLWLSVFLYFLAIFSKEHVVMLPAVMLVLTLLLVKPTGLVKRLWTVYLACALIAFYVVMQKFGLLGHVYEVNAPEMLEKAKITDPYPMSVLTQCFLYFKYWLLWLFPDPAWMSVDMREPFANSMFSVYILALIAFLGYGILGFKLLTKRGAWGLLGFAMLFPWLLFATELVTARIQESFVLYRSYLWMAGIFAALPIVLRYIDTSKAVIGMLMISIVLAGLSVNRLTIFSNPLLLWDDALELVKDKHDLPGVGRIYFNRGKLLTDVKRYQDALADYQVAVKLSPDFYYYRYGLAAGYMNMAHYSEAITEFDKAIELEPRFVRAYFGRGLADLEVGKNKAALADFERSCKMGLNAACARLTKLRQKS